jgi:sigma-B regulation protein RsbU (phosphoserine phosphatase)
METADVHAAAEHRVSVLSMQDDGTAARVAAALGRVPGLRATAVEPLDPQSRRIARECAAVVIVGPDPVPGDAISRIVDDAAADARPVIALVGPARAAQPPCPGVTLALDAQLGPEHLATALRALLARQREVERLRGEMTLAARFSGGLRHEMERLQDELQLAASVQREFLPRSLPSIGRFTASALWRPASYVSGDIYSVMRLDEHHLGAFLLDAVGHGVPAALLTLVISRGLQTKQIDGNAYRLLQPSESLAKVNADMVARGGKSTRFATAVYAVLDTRTGRVAISSAGHLPAIHARADGSLTMIEGVGSLLGIFEGESYPQQEVTLGPGEMLLLYSDGFEQAWPEAGQDPSEPRMPNLVYLDVFREALSAGSAQGFADAVALRLDAVVREFPQTDDLTLVCISADR